MALMTWEFFFLCLTYPEDYTQAIWDGYWRSEYERVVRLLDAGQRCF